MNEIILNNSPNQKIYNIVPDINLKIDLELYYNKIMFMNLYINDVVSLSNVPCKANLPLILYPYIIKKIGGNFIFKTEKDNYPIYENFNKTCKLYYFTNKETM